MALFYASIPIMVVLVIAALTPSFVIMRIEAAEQRRALHRPPVRRLPEAEADEGRAQEKPLAA